MDINDQTKVFYQPGKPGIIDLAVSSADGWLSNMTGDTLEQLRVRYPGAELGELGACVAATEALFRAAPVQITRDRYHEMIEVLPPEDWQNTAEGESFKLCERTSGNITAIFARIGETYYEMQDRATMKHADILATCKGAA